MAPTCREIEPELSLLADGTLPASDETRVALHLSGCVDCRALVADLETLRRAARAVGPLAPPDHVWLEVAGQIRLGGASPAVAQRTPRGPAWQWVGIAAALVLVTIALYLLQRVQPANQAVTTATQAVGSVDAVAEELNLAATHYQRALAELDAMAGAGENPLDEAVATDVRDSLGAIDLAIAESRAALASNPESEPARDSLFEALRRKIAVLQTTVSLINEMRSGDPEGAQQAADILGKKS